MSSGPKVYTRTGDKGKTSLIGGTRVAKSHVRLEAYGTVDELNSVLGVVIADMKTELARAPELPRLLETLYHIQSDLFNVGSQLACEDAATRGKLPGVTDDKVAAFEKEMDSYSSSLKPLKNFILPGGSRCAANAHIARTVCRRAERVAVVLLDAGETDELIVRYLNRLSDYLFVLARYLNHLLGVDEPLWGAGQAR